MAILEEVKLLANITSVEDDDILQHYIDVLTNEALAYTKQKELILQLETVIITYTIKMYRAKALDDFKNVVSIKRLDTETKFSDNGSNTIDEALLQSFRGALKSFRKLKAVIV